MKEVKPNIILLGAGGHCLSAIDVIELEDKYNIFGILDNQKSKGEKVLKYPVIGCDNDLQQFVNEKTYFLITVGQIKSPNIRVRLAHLIESSGGNLATVVSPKAYVSQYTQIGKGSIVMHNCVVNAEATIGKHCIINTMANIEHGVMIGDFCHISTGAMINGDALVGEGSFVGSNATLSHGARVECNAVIGAGKFIK